MRERERESEKRERINECVSEDRYRDSQSRQTREGQTNTKKRKK